MQLFSHLQWWSNPMTHLLHALQCFDDLSLKMGKEKKEELSHTCLAATQNRKDKYFFSKKVPVSRSHI